MTDTFILPGVFWDMNDDLSEIEDGEPGIVTIEDDEIICISSPTNIQIRFTLYEVEAILEYAHEQGINDIRDE